MPSADLIAIRLMLTGAREVVRESKLAATGIARIGAAARWTGRVAKASFLAIGRFSLMAGKWLAAGAIYETYRMVGAYREAYKVGRQTNAVLKSTGGVANVSAGHLQELSNTLSLQTGVDDEVIQSAGNLLLTFRNIRNEAGKNNDIFDQTLRATQNLATATGTDLTSAVKQVGKALHDPAVGLTALRRSGVSFSESQSEMINKLFESGKQLEAQKLILRELNKEFAGSARAQADPFDKLKVAFENVEEAGGALLFPTLAKGATALAKFFNQMRSGRGAGGDFVDVLKDVGGVLSSVFNWAVKVGGAIGAWVGGTGIPAAKDAWHGLTTGIKAGIKWIKSAWANIKRFAKTFLPLKIAIGFVVVQFKVMKAAIGVAFSLIKKIVPPAWELLKGFGRIVGNVVGFISNLFRGDFAGAWRNLKELVGSVVGQIGNTVKLLVKPFEWVLDRFEEITDKIEDIKMMLPGQSANGQEWIQDQIDQARADARDARGGNGDRHRGPGGRPRKAFMPPDVAPVNPQAVVAGGGGGGPSVAYLMLDGKVAAEAVFRASEDAQARS